MGHDEPERQAGKSWPEPIEIGIIAQIFCSVRDDYFVIRFIAQIPEVFVDQVS